MNAGFAAKRRKRHVLIAGVLPSLLATLAPLCGYAVLREGTENTSPGPPYQRLNAEEGGQIAECGMNAGFAAKRPRRHGLIAGVLPSLLATLAPLCGYAVLTEGAEVAFCRPR
jgi:uncharacterized membrane protein (GlpM family)